ncbi:MAG TPA: RNA 2',3'-cyclic phosphodiesterase [Steroidobacteraceae bacterium]|nr:RNA 2',3'-cyclic phosphodiesterase [Steroidobacteraceae bacterium]
MAAETPRSPAGPGEPARRLFFALWPDERMREALAEATRETARASGGWPVPAGNLHVTMAFLGSVPQRRLGELAEAARAAAPGPERDALGLSFDHLEYWRAAQLLCVAPAEPSAPAAALAGRLQARLAQSGFAPDLKPFRPHVTVVRKVSRPGRIGKMQPVEWSFTQLALIESRTLPEGSLYSVVESYALCGEP